MYHLFKQERASFCAIIFVIGFVLLGRWIFSPILSKIEKLNRVIYLQEKEIEQSLLIVTQGKNIETQRKQYVSYLSKPQAEEEEGAAFLKEVENIAKRSMVSLVDIKPAGSDEDDFAKRYFIKLNFEAQMEEAFDFFHKVTNFERLTRIEEYHIKPKSQGSSIMTCSISLSKAVIPE